LERDRRRRASAYDTATVTGVAGITPAGSVTYSFFDNATCSGTPATTDPVSLSAGVAPSSTTTGRWAPARIPSKRVLGRLQLHRGDRLV